MEQGSGMGGAVSQDFRDGGLSQLQEAGSPPPEPTEGIARPLPTGAADLHRASELTVSLALSCYVCGNLLQQQEETNTGQRGQRSHLPHPGPACGGG